MALKSVVAKSKRLLTTPFLPGFCGVTLIFVPCRVAGRDPRPPLQEGAMEGTLALNMGVVHVCA